MYVLHPLLRADAVEARDYQVQLAGKASQSPTLLVLPTGLGKTVVGLLSLLEHLERSPERKVLVLAPTKPLVEQHARVFSAKLEGVSVEALSGETPPAARDEAWRRGRVIVATPQALENDLVRGARDLKDVSFLIYDEAHRATGGYAYGFIARRYREAGGTHALGLTASPGSDIAKIHAVMTHLGLRRIEVRTEKDPDVAPYIHQVHTEWIRVQPTPSLVRVIGLLNRCSHRAVAQLRRLGYLDSLRSVPGRADLVDLGRRIRQEAALGSARRGVFEAATAQARALKIQHALELAETQGLTVLAAFLSRVQSEAEQAGGSRAARDFTKDPEFAEALALSREAPEPHPKVARAVEVVRQQLASGARRILVFANYRETAELILAALGTVPEARAHRFVGHARASGEKGLTKRGQQRVVDRFRAGDINVLVATSVAEEGLDLPETDAVILYEPVPSGIRMIQRRGRTGRRDDGKVFVLITQGTRDENYVWSSIRREKRMHEELAYLRKASQQITLPEAPAPALPAPASPDRIELVADVRESAGPVPRILVDRGALVKTQTLEVGDYVVGGRFRVERKSALDFVASLKDGRLFEQAARLGSGAVAVFVVEGDAAEIVAHIGVASYYGALAALVRDHGATVMTVPDAGATAQFLISLARREMADGRPAAALRAQKRQSSSGEELRFLLEGLPSVGPVLAQRLLRAFGSVASVAAAGPSALAEVEGVGAERARTIHEVLHRPFVELSAVAPQGGAVAPLEAGDGPAR